MSFNEGKIIPIDIKNEMKKCYIDYAMSVIVGRALPDVRDGLKPVHRRILYAMKELNLYPEKGYRKCARIVGEVLGKYHPHGDSSVYEALVRMAQDFSMREMLVDGHGNFGSVDGDSAAAMRYTEAKMAKIASEMLRDIQKNTVDFIPNFDGEEEEPVVLPSRYPNLLVNGSSGIAVGMATNIPPHNLAEVIDGTIALMENPELASLELMQYIKGPDFPTSGIIMGRSGIRAAYETGRGKVVVRAKAEIEEENGRNKIIVTELPYQVNKARLVESIANLVKDKKLTGISDLRDESDRDGMRVVIELKRDANANVVLNMLYKHTKMQDTFGIINLALVNNEPQVLNLKQMLAHYIEFQKEVVTRRTIFDVNKANERAHILEGLRIALDNIDVVISIIRNSKTSDIAKAELMDKFNLSEKQSTSILEMRLRRLTGLERDKIEAEYNELMKLIDYLNEILGCEIRLLEVIKEELLAVRAKFATPRLSYIEQQMNEIDIEDLIQEEDVVITLTHSGYVKRIQADTYSAQNRGGKGIQAMTTKGDDFVEHVFVTSTHSDVLFFTNLGKVYKLRAYEIPDAGRTAKGLNLVNLIQIDADERIETVLTIKDSQDTEGFLFMATKQGVVKKTPIAHFKNIRKSGLIAISLRDGDELLKVKVTHGDANMIVVTRNGYAIRFKEEDVRPMGRTASGVRAIRLRKDDYAVCLDIAVEEEKLLIISENGIGKRTPLSEYKVQNRGGMGLITYKVTEKTGKVAGATVCKFDDEMMLINTNGVAIRIGVEKISITGRATSGVNLMRTINDEVIVAIAKIPASEKINVSDDESIEDVEFENVEENLVQETLNTENGLEELIERAESEEE
ncbi:DNA gyrase subunit A [uncultured Clostridium sp.]|jgi:DNA gyrase subunit A|uniref:DNA gyrase subunit A n=1 Tax=uncultured Clostridium sp. TaxID=59620 RepID=UPI002635AE02|nr:DNA gyrase subunit A [uncultured Clostridium sp.]